MNALKILQQMDDEQKRTKYKSIPDHALPKSKFKDNGSNELTSSVIKWLELNGHWATRVSSAGRYVAAKGKFIPSTTKKGCADIHAVIFGKHVSIEIKYGADRLREDQLLVKEQIEKAGGLYVVVKTFQQFFDWYNENFLNTNNR
jgi:hypothetical protein